MNVFKHKSVVLLSLLAIMTSACTTQNVPLNKSESTVKTQKTETTNSGDTALSIGATTIGYLLGAVLAAAII